VWPNIHCGGICPECHLLLGHSLWLFQFSGMFMNTVKQTVITRLFAAACWHKVGEARCWGRSTLQAQAGVCYPSEKCQQCLKLWMHSRQNKCSLKRYNAAWPFQVEPVSSIAMPTVAVYSVRRAQLCVCLVMPVSPFIWECAALKLVVQDSSVEAVSCACAMCFSSTPLSHAIAVKLYCVYCTIMLVTLSSQVSASCSLKNLLCIHCDF
jgi:hypothetical protein